MTIFFKKYNTKSKIVYKICGIKFTKIKYSYEKRFANLEDLVRHSISPTEIPPANGILKDIQDAELKLLQEIDEVCKKTKIKYWLDFGALLGAVRHQGFIPWDDDIDLGMMREDYEKFQNEFNNLTANKNLFVELYSHKNGNGNILKVRHKLLPTIFIDIFPYDYYTKKLDTDGKIKLHNKIHEIQRKFRKKAPKNKSELPQFHQSFSILRDKFILKGEKPDLTLKPSIFWGIEFEHAWKRCVFDFETLFPLAEINFCGKTFPCPNKTDLVLTTVYKDYMSLPASLHYHFDISALTIEEIQNIKQYSKGNL